MMKGETEVDREVMVHTAVHGGDTFEAQWDQIGSDGDASGNDGRVTAENKKMMKETEEVDKEAVVHTAVHGEPTFEAQWDQIGSDSDATGSNDGRVTTAENKKGAGLLKLRKPSYRSTLVLLGIVAAALLIMVVAIATTQFTGGSSEPAGNANEAQGVSFTPRPTPSPTKLISISDAADPMLEDEPMKPTKPSGGTAAEMVEEDSDSSIPAPSPPTTLAPTNPKPNLRTSTAPTATPPTLTIVGSGGGDETNPSTTGFFDPGIEATAQQEVDPSTLSYVPGDLSTKFRGVKLSTGLSAKRIAKTDGRVQLKGDTKSDVDFGPNPETAAVFRDPNGDGWIYVVNFDKSDGDGGVGALTFDSDGEAMKYEVVLEGTTENTGGGASPWGTFVSCENVKGEGQIYEVDPTGATEAKKTTLGQKGGSYKGVSFDNRNERKPVFFVGASDPKSFVMRYTPSDATMASDEGPAFRVLHEEGGTFEYLVVAPSEGDDSVGTFSWTESSTLGLTSSQDYFQDVAGVEFHDGTLYVLSEEQKELFIFDTDTLEYKKESSYDAFDGDPSEVVHILKSDRRLIQSKDKQPILYFAETNDSSSGIHGRTENGDYVVIAEDDEKQGDAVGLAFSPDRRHLYFAFKDIGNVFDLTRDDGQPFDGATLDIAFNS